MNSRNGSLELKDGFTRDDLSALAGDGDGWRLSFYMPLSRTGREVMQAPILLKEMRSRAAAELEARGCGPDAAAELLEPIDRIYEGTEVAILQGAGLAVLSSTGFSASFLLPEEPPAMVSVDKRFALEPLLPLLFEDGRFFLLALSLNAVRLWEADRLHLREVSFEGMDTNLRDALHLEEDEAYHMFHAGAPASGRNTGSSMFYGYGGGGGDNKDGKRNILEFFRLIDKGVRLKLPDSDTPLMLTGVESLMPIYRQANSHPSLLDGFVPGNQDAIPDRDDLHAKAWMAFGEERDRGKKRVLALYQERLASPLAVSGLRNVIQAAHQGRVNLLFVRKGARQWGWFDPSEYRIEFADGPVADAEELFNRSCILALTTGAKVYMLNDGEIPEGADIAALCRY